MIDLYYWPTPNGHKITIFLEEAGLPYRLIPINIFKGEQFAEQFLKISPNNRIPAIVDHDPTPIAIFESGAILLYLSEKSGQFLPTDAHNRYEVLQWLFWQVGGLGPMAGQNHHFNMRAPEVTYARERYINETTRLYTVLDKHLKGRQFIGQDYSIADMACYPWILLHEKQSQNLDDYPELKRWMDSIQSRPAVQRAYERTKEFDVDQPMTEEAKKILFEQKKNL
ncbi:glutathione S-transferase N-terminal domain-containing protein [Legionella sp. CNM-4043-24]|uniref:glutathione S-transferase N-terminal domain-containing protein n=1 Tax=Legionella sp. CNM-4043-24 TaxID=3421646 RepID=UPI00403AD18E